MRASSKCRTSPNLRTYSASHYDLFPRKKHRRARAHLSTASTHSLLCWASALGPSCSIQLSLTPQELAYARCTLQNQQTERRLLSRSSAQAPRAPGSPDHRRRAESSSSSSARRRRRFSRRRCAAACAAPRPAAAASLPCSGPRIPCPQSRSHDGHHRRRRREAQEERHRDAQWHVPLRRGARLLPGASGGAGGAVAVVLLLWSWWRCGGDAGVGGSDRRPAAAGCFARAFTRPA